MNRAASDNPLGLGLVIVGAAAMAIAAFLPLDEPTGAFRMVQANTLIQHGGWILIALALGIAASGYRVNRSGTARRVPIVLCVIAAGLIVVTANDKDLRTLYPVGPDGNPITTQPGMVANLGMPSTLRGRASPQLSLAESNRKDRDTGRFFSRTVCSWRRLTSWEAPPETR